MDNTRCSRYIIARLDGDTVQRDFSRYEALVRMGIAGFIIFGGELEEVRDTIRRLQSIADRRLIISSDLERGLGQQLKGGTDLPPACVMGIAWKSNPALVEDAFDILAKESSYAGINTIFAPVLDIDSNPLNPIISTRAFGVRAEDVIPPALAMMEALAKHGIIACGKHYPGHGDTSTDSHMSLPVIDKTMNELESMELIPFRRTIAAGLPMIMAAHMSVPALDDSGMPVTLSKPAIDYLKKDLGFDGLITTDAMDMKALDAYTHSEAALMALRAGADVILHPHDPEQLIKDMASSMPDMPCRLDALRGSLNVSHDVVSVPQKSVIATEITRLSLTSSGTIRLSSDMEVIALCDDGGSDGAEQLARLLGCQAIIVNSADSPMPVMKGRGYILTVSSDVRAYKGGHAGWVTDMLGRLANDADVIVSFTSSHLFDNIDTCAPIIHARWDAAQAGEAVYKEFFIDAS